MNKFLTKEETVEGEISIFALANSKYAIKNGKPPFYYEFYHSNSHWNNEATLVITHKMLLSVPGGIDLLAKTIETLEAKKKEIEATAYGQAMEIQKRIDGLLMIEHIPEKDEGDIEGEVVDDVVVSDSGGYDDPDDDDMPF